MPYLGNEPGAITDAFTDTFTGDGSETAFTLTQASTTNSVFVRIHGVMQRNGTDFNVDGTTLTFTTAPPNASNNIVVQFFTIGSVQAVADNAVVTAKINDNAVTLAKLAGGTDGNIISFDASGDPVAVATGNDGQVLTSAGAGAAPAFEAIPAQVGAGWEFISTITASNASDIVFESMTTGYDWSFVGSNMIAKTDSQIFNTLVGIAGPTYRTANYLGHTFDMAAGGANGTDKTSQFGTHRTNQGTGTAEQFGFQAFLIDPANASTKTNFQSFGGSHNAGSHLSVDVGFGYNTAEEAHTCVKFVMASGNIDGKVDVYRRPNA